MSEKSRRAFLISSATGLNAAWVAANLPEILAAQDQAQQAARTGHAKLSFFNEAQAAEIEAITAQIIPSDEDPGAREAHCVIFIDRALSGFDKSKQAVYTAGLEDLRKKVQELYPGAAKFSALTSEQQIKTLTAMERTPFFTVVRNHTVMGFLSRPSHGGNYNKVGWKLIAYDDSLNFKPPFGYYDAQYENEHKA
ncbi:MAG TPA: gluconate 2-dehydrogenase subunit 3 family protein [Bryobacteraceae bacterium]|jgi:gluconate 2-dehydrogenase gamma chain|nr:gluconate 2-dehydrogenase subunit 3 family protein [Bryobacteraceae bacterium]